MYSKIIINIILIISLSIIQVSFISGLPYFLSLFNLSIISLILILVIKDLEYAIYWSLGFGLLFDMIYFSPFGIFILCFTLTVIFSNYLLIYLFTNRSLYSFIALTFLATIFYNFIYIFLIFILNFITPFEFEVKIDINFFKDLLTEVILNIIIIIIAFYVLNFLSRKLKPVFLTKDNKY